MLSVLGTAGAAAAAMGQTQSTPRPPVPAERTGAFRDDVTRITRAIAAELEELIRRAPEQWHLMQPNWPSDVEGPAATTGSPRRADRP